MVDRSRHPILFVCFLEMMGWFWCLDLDLYIKLYLYLGSLDSDFNVQFSQGGTFVEYHLECVGL